MNYSLAVKFLQQSDPTLGKLIAQVGGCHSFPGGDRQPASSPGWDIQESVGLGLRVTAFRDPQPNAEPSSSTLLQEMARAIIAQQISTQAAASIYQRFLQLYPLTLDAATLLNTPEEQLREAGISRPKIGYLKDLAQKVVAGLVTEELVVMDDEAVIATLTQIRGVGRWTAQMLLIFYFKRLNVWPVDDLGIRKGIQKLYELEQLPDRKTVEYFGQRWQPYRSIASWYLWRSLEQR